MSPAKLVALIDRDLCATRIKWREAIQVENREAEAVCMARLDTLLERRTERSEAAR